MEGSATLSAVLFLTVAMAADLPSPAPSQYIVARLDEPGALEGDPLAGDGLTLRVRAEGDVEDFAREVAMRPGVAWAHVDRLVQLVPATDDPLYADQWHLQNTGQGGRFPGVDLNAEAAWDYTIGEGIVVAIVDSGVDSTHPDLMVVDGYDYVDGDTDANPEQDEDSYAHGTACAGVTAAIGDNGLGGAGVAWGAEIMPIRLLGDGGVYYSTVHDAWVETAEAGATVISNSWSFSASECNPFNSIPVIDEAMELVDEAGSLLVMSAGNAGCDMSSDGVHANSLMTSVGAITDSDQLTSYSNWGDLVDVVAPSGGIVTTDVQGGPGYSGDDYYLHYSGTSASAPAVAGIYALMFAANDRLTPQLAREALCTTAVRNDPVNGAWGADGISFYYGCGRADAGAAVASVYNDGPPLVSAEVLEETKDHAVLWWTGEDPDGDAITYVLEVDGEVMQEGPELSWELPDAEDMAVGDVVEFTVTPWDRWGPGESVSSTFTVLKRDLTERPAGTCSSVAGGGLLLGLLALLGLRR